METAQSSSEIFFHQEPGVIVTQSRFIAGNKTYAMRNISSVHLFKIEKRRTWPILFLVAGVIMLAPESLRVLGIILAVVGGIWLFTIKDEYAVRISTNAGEANSLVSKDELYIQKIVNALNEAIIHRG